MVLGVVESGHIIRNKRGAQRKGNDGDSAKQRHHGDFIPLESAPGSAPVSRGIQISPAKPLPVALDNWTEHRGTGGLIECGAFINHCGLSSSSYRSQT